MKVIISGGGTGGHIFPAVAIADAIKSKLPDVSILFVGAMGRMEMEKIPLAGYKIIGLDIAGIQRKLSLKNLLLPFKLLKSLKQARSVINEFKPDVAVGVGGYASGPLLQMCGWMGIPYVIQEQNSYAGVTNKILSKKAERIFVAYENMNNFFESSKIELTGNPVREQITKASTISTLEARENLGIDLYKKTILIFGGSLGARSLNSAILNNASILESNPDVQILWQVGKLYYDEYSKSELAKYPHIKILAFIEDMATAYKAADIVVSRAGALTISELCVLGLPSILVPSPNVAEDHQTHNAMALVNVGAALMVKDSDAYENLVPEMMLLINDQPKRNTLSTNLLKLSKLDAADKIANYIISLPKRTA